MPSGFSAWWLGPLSTLSSVVEGISTIAFLGYLVFMASMGVAILRRRLARLSARIE
jgi:hypothetical protein